MHYIFRKSDGVHFATAHRPESIETQFAAVLANEGGVEDDYIVVESQDTRVPSGTVAMLDSSGNITYVTTPERAARDATKASLIVKLRALNLSDDEARLLAGN